MGQPDQDLRELDGMDGGPVTVLFAGQSYAMGMIEPSDYVNCAADRAASRIKVIFDTIPTNIMQDVSGVKAEMGAKVLSTPCSPWDLLGDCEGVCRLAARALNRGGHPEINYLGLMHKPTQFPYAELERAVLRVSGFKMPERKKTDAVSTNPPQAPFTT